MAAAEARGMRVVAGKVMMDRNAPEGLRDDAVRGYEESKALIARWHGRARLGYAVTPRFAPTSSPEQLEAAGALWAEHPDCAMQTHLCEQREEIAWVRELYPHDRDYLGVYERFGLVGPGAVMGHVIHLTAREWAAMTESGSGIAHCPTSNTFIGSGLFDWDQCLARGIPVGLATDVGGGSSFSMLRTMAAAYEVGQLGGRVLHPAELLWLATEGSARVLRLGGVVGRLAEGAEADLVVLDLASTPAIAERAARAEDLWEAVFPTIMMGDDRAVQAVFVGGRQVAFGAATA
jgi:guanine deaminase